MRAVLQHRLAHSIVEGVVSRPAIPLLHQQRKIAAMVNMRMREHDRVQLLRRECQLLVDFTSLLPMSLKQTTIP